MQNSIIPNLGQGVRTTCYPIDDCNTTETQKWKELIFHNLLSQQKKTSKKNNNVFQL